MACKGCAKKKVIPLMQTFTVRIVVSKISDTKKTRDITQKLKIYAKELINKN